MRINWINRSSLIELGDPPSNHYGGDMYSLRPEGQYLVSWSIPDGWTVWEPIQDKWRKWAYDGHEWVAGSSEAPPRGVPGAAKLEEAQAFAESLIKKHTRTTPGRGRRQKR